MEGEVLARVVAVGRGPAAQEINVGGPTLAVGMLVNPGARPPGVDDRGFLVDVDVVAERVVLAYGEWAGHT